MSKIIGAFFVGRRGMMWNPKWFIEVPTIVKIIVLAAGFFILAGSCFLSRIDDGTEEKTDDNKE